MTSQPINKFLKTIRYSKHHYKFRTLLFINRKQIESIIFNLKNEVFIHLMTCQTPFENSTCTWNCQLSKLKKRDL